MSGQKSTLWIVLGLPTAARAESRIAATTPASLRSMTFLIHKTFLLFYGGGAKIHGMDRDTARDGTGKKNAPDDDDDDDDDDNDIHGNDHEVADEPSPSRQIFTMTTTKFPPRH